MPFVIKVYDLFFNDRFMFCVLFFLLSFCLTFTWFCVCFVVFFSRDASQCYRFNLAHCLILIWLSEVRFVAVVVFFSVCSMSICACVCVCVWVLVYLSYSLSVADANHFNSNNNLFSLRYRYWNCNWYYSFFHLWTHLWTTFFFFFFLFSSFDLSKKRYRLFVFA